MYNFLSFFNCLSTFLDVTLTGGTGLLGSIGEVCWRVMIFMYNVCMYNVAVHSGRAWGL